MTTIPRSFGANLSAARKAAHLSQSDLAARLGYQSKTAICLWERSPTVPSVETIQKLADALGCEPSVLLRNVVTPYDVLRGSVKAAEARVLSAEEEQWLVYGFSVSKAFRQSIIHMITVWMRRERKPLPAGADARYRTPGRTPKTDADNGQADARRARSRTRAATP